MPYVAQERRADFGRFNDALLDVMTSTEIRMGDLTYMISLILYQFVRLDAPTFERLGTVEAALSVARMDFEEHFLKPYERMKEEMNGPL